MDAKRFDDLSRVLATIISRQGVIRFLARLSTAGVAAFTRIGNGGESPASETVAKKSRRKNPRRKKRCPGKKDKVCHCPPGNTDNCHITGNGSGHFNHKLDCCCTRNGRRNPFCNCSGGACSKGIGGNCANSLQCGGGGICANIVNGIGVCVAPNCQPQTCDDFPGQCGPQDDGCGGQTANCTCPNTTDTCEAGTCVSCEPNTCAANLPGQCGAFPNGCGDEMDCPCATGECCDGACTGTDECCQANDCPRQLCQVRACNDGTCEYTPVPDNEPGAFCLTQGRFCCNGDECCAAGDVCTGQGCCTPLTCAPDFPGQCGAFADSCGGTLTCSCNTGPCCDGICLTGDQCCAVADCAEEVCQTVECLENTCTHSPVADNDQGPLCTGEGDFCCNGNECCENDELCFGFGCCSPQTQEEACAGSNVECHEVSDGCGGTFDCGPCPSDLTCLAGICLLAGGGRKRCKGTGMAGHPCKGKKCKCKAGRRCHHGKCCEPIGDGSRHCNANSDCCPGLTCVRKALDQHKVCLRKSAGQQSVI